MYGRELLRVNCVERPEQIQFAVVIGRRVAQNCHLNVHPGTSKAQIPRIGTNLFCPVIPPPLAFGFGLPLIPGALPGTL
jgi:hypothetical protein